MELVDWIRQQLQSRGWTQNELARRAGISSSQLSTFLNHSYGAGPKFCVGIAHAFGVAPTVVFSLAGIFTESQSNSGFEELEFYFKQLEPDDQRHLLVVARALYRNQRDDESA